MPPLIAYVHLRRHAQRKFLYDLAAKTSPHYMDFARKFMARIIVLFFILLPSLSAEFNGPHLIFSGIREDPADPGTPGIVVLSVETGIWMFWDNSNERFHPNLSPDGRTMVYRKGDSIYLEAFDRSEEPRRIVSSETGGRSALTWSPQGDRLAYFKLDESETELIVLDLDGSVIAQHTIGPYWDQAQPSWSPDGTKIAILGASQSGNGYGIYTVDVNTGSIAHVFSAESTSTNSAYAFEDLDHPKWSPVSNEIAFIFERRSGFWDGSQWQESESNNIAIVPASGGEPRLVTNNPSEDRTMTLNYLAWSPDGSHIAFWQYRYDANPVFGQYSVPSDGSGVPQKISHAFPGGGSRPPGEFFLTSAGYQWVDFPDKELEIAVEPNQTVYNGGDFVEVVVTLNHPGGLPVTYLFEDQLFTVNPEAEELENQVLILEPAEKPRPVTLSEENPTWTGVLPGETNASGYVALSTSVTAVQAAGIPYSLEDSTQIIVSPLKMDLRALPLIEEEPIVNMTLEEVKEQIIVKDEEGTIIEPKVEVTFTNISDAPFTAFLQGLDPRPRDESDTVGRIATGDAWPLEIGILQPGEVKTATIDLQLFEDGRYDFVATATGFYEAIPEATFVATETGAPIAVGERYPVELEINYIESSVITAKSGRDGNEALLLQPGGALRIVAAVTNRTTNSKLYFYGIKAKKTRNAMSGHLTSQEGRAGNELFPFVHDHFVDPNAAVVLGGNVFTSPEGAPTGKIEWQGLEDLALIDIESEERIELTEKDILFTGNLSNMELRIIRDDRTPPVPVVTDAQAAGIYGRAVIHGMGEWAYDTFDAIGGLGRVAAYIYEDPSLLADTWGEGTRVLYETVELMKTAYEEMTPDEKETFWVELVVDIQQRLLLMSSTARLPTGVDPESYEAVLKWTQEATRSLFDGVEAAYASDDPARIAEELGRVSGHAAMEVIMAFVSEIKFAKYVKGSEINKFTKNASLGPALNSQETALRLLKSGPISKSTALAAFGVGADDIKKFQEVFTAFKVKGYARERSPIADNLINNRGVAIWKMEAMKPKGISDIDELIMGTNTRRLLGSDGQPIELRGITGIFWPGDNETVLARLAGKDLSPELIDACLARAAMRRKEYNNYIGKFNKWKQEGIPVSPNYKDNGVPDPVGSGGVTRGFQVEEFELSNGSKVIIPQVTNQDGQFRYISGDIDWVHFSNLDGTPLDPKKASQLYTVLMDCCGLQHPETVSWINDGQAFFNSKADQIAEYVRGEKALFELSYMGPRAVRVSPNLTRFRTNLFSRDHLVFFENGIKSRIRATAADWETAFSRFKPQLASTLVPPLFIAKLNAPTPESLDWDTTVNGNEWVYAKTRRTVEIITQAATGDLQLFNGSAWVPYDLPDPSSDVVPEGHYPQLEGNVPIAFAPTAPLEEDAFAGDTILTIQDIPGEWGALIGERIEEWFAAGDEIVVAPGEPNQEVRTLVGVEPLRLDRPLDFDHRIDTIVSIVPPGLFIEDRSEIASELKALVEDDRGVTLVWSATPGLWYQLEVEASPGHWAVLQESLYAGTVALPTPLLWDDYDPAANYRLVRGRPGEIPLEILASDPDPVTGLASLVWPLGDSDSYLIDVSPSLQPGSWGTLSTEITLVDQHGVASVPLSPDSSSRFFRVRSSSSPYILRLTRMALT
jgi:Tol biopolymer transport system component